MEPMLETYNENGALQATCQTVGNPMLASMATAYDARTPDALKFVRIAEYGCSGGRNSYAPMHDIISALRGSSAGLRAECVLDDLPSNPWHQVMVEMPRLTAAFAGRVQVLCAGVSFYEQICADESLDLAFSYVSAHFLNETMPLTSHVLPHESSDAEKTAWLGRAANDWERFFQLRARELKPGGKLMVSTMSRGDDGYSWQHVSHVVWDSIRGAHARAVLSSEEIEALCIPACLRSEAEIMAPFGPNGTQRSSFSVDSLEFFRTEVPGEKELPADMLAPLVRRRVEAVWGGMFFAQLIALGRTRASAREAMREVWDAFEDTIAQDTARGWLDMRSFYLQLTKR